MNAIFIQCIFGPNEEILELNLNSLKSLKTYLEKSDEEPFPLIFTGWCAKEEYWKKIDFILDDFPDKWIDQIVLKSYNKNYGKAYIINNTLQQFYDKTLAFDIGYVPILSKHNNKQYPYIFIFDSDICFEQSDIFRRAINIFKDTTNLGLLAFNQQQNNCHWTKTFDKETTLLEERDMESGGNIVAPTEILRWSSTKTGIAGGAICVRLDAWNIVGGYNIGNQPYHGEDGILLRDIQAIGFDAKVAMTLNVIHPFYENPKYDEWKKKAMKEVFDPKSEKRRLRNIEASMEFWK